MRLTFAAALLTASVIPTVLSTPVDLPDSTVILGTAGDDHEGVSPAGLAVRGAIEPRSFHQTCQNCIQMIQYSQWHVLRCSCRKSNGSYQDTSLNLDGCLENNNGYLQWNRNGFSSAHCTSPQYSTGAGGTIILWITCLNGAQQYVGTGFTISERIHNYNGVLGCDVPN